MGSYKEKNHFIPFTTISFLPYHSLHLYLQRLYDSFRLNNVFRLWGLLLLYGIKNNQQVISLLLPLLLFSHWDYTGIKRWDRKSFKWVLELPRPRAAHLYNKLWLNLVFQYSWSLDWQLYQDHVFFCGFGHVVKILVLLQNCETNELLH